MKHLLICSVTLILISCGTSKIPASATSSNEITSLSYFEPISYIQYIEKGNTAMLSDSLSLISRNKLDSILSENKEDLRLSEKIILDDQAVKGRIENEVAYYAALMMQRKKLNKSPLAKTIDSVMESNHQRFALATVVTGFGRRKGNYRGQVAKGAAIGILTLGMAIPTPVKSNVAMYALIFDSEKNQVAYYRMCMPVEKDPTDEKILGKQFASLFKDYLSGKK
ncbi:MAG TPA: hypothetical protein VN722_00760 [Hanamia sp.]|nr:hypothetical protein [Hanamia sp.]